MGGEWVKQLLFTKNIRININIKEFWVILFCLFQMFVRLFIDENLDRMVPISKQPKEKIQAIIEACYRQFPEFHERARKRIRTYLKSCRRMKRHRDQNGLDSVRNQNVIRPDLFSLSKCLHGVFVVCCRWNCSPCVSLSVVIMCGYRDCRTLGSWISNPS